MMLSGQTPTVRDELKSSVILAAASTISPGAVHSSWFWPRMGSPPTVQKASREHRNLEANKTFRYATSPLLVLFVRHGTT